MLLITRNLSYPYQVYPQKSASLTSASRRAVRPDRGNLSAHQARLRLRIKCSTWSKYSLTASRIGTRSRRRLPSVTGTSALRLARDLLDCHLFVERQPFDLVRPATNRRRRIAARSTSRPYTSRHRRRRAVDQLRDVPRVRRCRSSAPVCAFLPPADVVNRLVAFVDAQQRFPDVGMTQDVKITWSGTTPRSKRLPGDQHRRRAPLPRLSWL